MHGVTLRDPDVDIAYLDLPGSTPDAPSLVMLHGLGASAETTFLETASHEALSMYRRILIDLPGFGASRVSGNWSGTIEDQADVVALVLDRLQLVDVALIGHSMGGSVAIVLATRRPDLIERLIVAEPNLDPHTGEFSGQIVRTSESAFLTHGCETVLRALRLQARRGDRIAAVFGQTVEQAYPQALYRSAVSLRADRDPSFRIQLETLAMPRLYIAGETSNGVAGNELTPHRIAFVEMAKAGHVMMQDDPDAFARIVAEFLD
jgi:pimeloyl-ACP methyl ester carboxylesterase